MYCIDTSTFINSWNELYPIDVFPTFWSRMSGLIDHGSICAPDEVLYELSKKDDELHRWVKNRQQGLIVGLEVDVQVEASRVLQRFPRLTNALRDRGTADPFVVAVGICRNLAVVTAERENGTENHPKIPMVCNYFGVRCLRIVEFIRENGWTFWCRPNVLPRQRPTQSPSLTRSTHVLHPAEAQELAQLRQRGSCA